jgi:hypothetical protein
VVGTHTVCGLPTQRKLRQLDSAEARSGMLARTGVKAIDQAASITAAPSLKMCDSTHGRRPPIFDLDFACVCLISLMRVSSSDRVCGNAPLVSFASYGFFCLRIWASQIRGAQA